MLFIPVLTLQEPKKSNSHVEKSDKFGFGNGIHSSNLNENKTKLPEKYESSLQNRLHLDLNFWLFFTKMFLVLHIFQVFRDMFNYQFKKTFFFSNAGISFLFLSLFLDVGTIFFNPITYGSSLNIDLNDIQIFQINSVFLH